jgi:glucose-1-phosphate thymidylyltransferase
MGRGYAWLDTGTHEALHQASSFVQILEQRQGFKVACIEEIAYRKAYINAAQLRNLARPLANSSYGRYLMELLENSEEQELLNQSPLNSPVLVYR